MPLVGFKDVCLTHFFSIPLVSLSSLFLIEQLFLNLRDTNSEAQWGFRISYRIIMLNQINNWSYPDGCDHSDCYIFQIAPLMWQIKSVYFSSCYYKDFSQIVCKDCKLFRFTVVLMDKKTLENQKDQTTKTLHNSLLSCVIIIVWNFSGQIWGKNWAFEVRELIKHPGSANKNTHNFWKRKKKN